MRLLCICVDLCTVEWSFYVYHLPRHGMWLKINFRARKKNTTIMNTQNINEEKSSIAHNYTQHIQLCLDSSFRVLFLQSLYILSLCFYWKWHPWVFSSLVHSVLFGTITCSFYPCQTTNWLQWKYPVRKFRRFRLNADTT